MVSFESLDVKKVGHGCTGFGAVILSLLYKKKIGGEILTVTATLNVPLDDRIDDENYQMLFKSIMGKVMVNLLRQKFPGANVFGETIDDRSESSHSKRKNDQPDVQMPTEFMVSSVHSACAGLVAFELERTIHGLVVKACIQDCERASYEDLMVAGIIDSTKVASCCEGHATSVAKTFLISDLSYGFYHCHMECRKMALSLIKLTEKLYLF